MEGFFNVGVGRFELPTSSSRTKRANRAALHPEKEPDKNKNFLMMTKELIILIHIQRDIEAIVIMSRYTFCETIKLL
jgi:hypothetical protein